MNSYDLFQSSVPPVLCDYCESSNHNACNYPYRAYIDAKCASVKKTINALTNRMLETMKVRIAKYSQCFTQSRENCSEPDSSLGSPEHVVGLDDDFGPSYRSRTT